MIDKVEVHTLPKNANKFIGPFVKSGVKLPYLDQVLEDNIEVGEGDASSMDKIRRYYEIRFLSDHVAKLR